MHQKLIISLFLLLPVQAFAWGQRGHHSICDAAVFLVKEPVLKKYLQYKNSMMGHLCNMPDYYWKTLGPEIRNAGDASHFVDADLLDMPIDQIPTNYADIISKYTGTKNKFNGNIIRSVPNEFGSNWWRAEQFYKRAIAAGSAMKKLTPPNNQKDEFDEKNEFNKSLFDFLVNLGLMGHFVGDNGQPFHVTFDHDGYTTGHGGIHGLYEDIIVGALPYDLQAQIVQAGKKIQDQQKSKNKKTRDEVKFLSEKTVVEKMRALAKVSFSDLPKIYKLDVVLKPSEQKDIKGLMLRTPAERAPFEQTVKNFAPLIITEMGRSAALLAELWDEAFREIGSPLITASKSYKFPLTVEFIPPDYYQVNPEDKKTSH